MVNYGTLFLIFVTLASVSAQTFQYSRGWTNGKRDGNRRHEERDFSHNLEKILSPCQMNKLRYMLEGKPYNEKLFVPCDYDYENDVPKRYRDGNMEQIMDPFQ